MTNTTFSLKTLLVPSKSVQVEYPGMPGFMVDLAFLSRETLLSIRKKSTKTSFKNRQAAEEFNEDLFLQLYVENAVKGLSARLSRPTSPYERRIALIASRVRL